MPRTNVQSGENLASALSALSQGAWLTAVGDVEAVELSLAYADGSADKSLSGRWTLASLAGPAGGPFWVVLSRLTETGVSVVAGQLKQATSCGVHVFGQGGAEAEVASEPAAQPTAPAKSDWAAQAKAAAPRAAPEPEEEVWPEVGDLVDHFAFGLCDVLMASDDRLKIPRHQRARADS